MSSKVALGNMLTGGQSGTFMGGDDGDDGFFAGFSAGEILRGVGFLWEIYNGWENNKTFQENWDLQAERNLEVYEGSIELWDTLRERLMGTEIDPDSSPGPHGPPGFTLRGGSTTNLDTGEVTPMRMPGPRELERMSFGPDGTARGRGEYREQPPRNIPEIAAEYGGKARDFYNRDATLGRYQDAFDPIVSGLTDLETDFAATGQGILAEAGGYVGESAAVGEDIMGRYARAEAVSEATGRDIIRDTTLRQQTGLDMMEDMGAQARQDIDTRYEALAAQQHADLVSRGLIGTSEGPVGAQALELQRSADVRRLDEELLNTRMDWTAGLSGDVINAMGGQQGITNQMAMAGIGGLEAQQGIQNPMNMFLTSLGVGQQLGAANIGSGVLGAQADIAGAGLDYQDEGMQQYMTWGSMFEQMPWLFDIQLTQAQVDAMTNVNFAMPTPPQPSDPLGWLPG